MPKFFILLLPLLLFASEWKAYKTLDQIKLYEKQGKESGSVRFRAETIMPFSSDVIASTIMDHNSYTSWLSDCVKAERTQEKVYLLMQPPWPLSRRQVWVTVTKKAYLKKQVMIIDSLDIKSPSSDAVWFNTLHAEFVLEALKGPETKVTLTLYGDIGGSVPLWLVDLQAWRIPYDSLRDLQKYLNSE